MGGGRAHNEQADNARREKTENEKLHGALSTFNPHYPRRNRGLLSRGTSERVEPITALVRRRMKTIFINGKFTAQRTTGVQRFASCIVDALDRVLPSSTSGQHTRWVLLCPPGAMLPALRNISVRQIGRGVPSLHLWEQVLLPLATRGSLLLNLSGSAPLLKQLQVCTFHDAAAFDHPSAHTWAFGAWYRFLFRQLARDASLLFTVSAFSKQRLVACLDIVPARVAVLSESGAHMLPLDADVSALQRLGLRPESYFVAVGSANPVKNFRALLDAFALLPERCDAQLVIVGSANNAVFAGGGGAPEASGVLRAGSLTDEELKALYQSALGLIFPSVYEGFGLPPLEAMSCGCPVAASTAAAIPEACGDAALYFDPHVPSAISAAMMQLFDEPELRQELRARGTRRSEAFTWESAARTVISRLESSHAPELARP